MPQKSFPFNDWLPFLGPEKSVILLKIWMLSQKHGYCYASQSTLAHQCGIKLRHFKDLMSELRKESFFKFHEKPQLRKPLKLSLTEKAFYPKSGASHAPNEQPLVHDTHQTDASRAPDLVRHTPSNNKIIEETTGQPPAHAYAAGLPGAEPTPHNTSHTEEQLQDPLYRFDGLEPEASLRLCQAVKDISYEYGVKHSRTFWHLWRNVHPVEFRQRLKTIHEKEHIQGLIEVLQTFLHKEGQGHLKGL